MNWAWAGGPQETFPAGWQSLQQVVDPGHSLLHMLVERFGSWTVLGLVGLGLLVLFKKRIEKVLKDWLT